MGKALLCVGKTAGIPYDLPKIGISIYSIEELCFLFKEETVLIDDSIACRPLIDWIRDECGLSELADSLYPFLRAGGSASAFAGTILEYVGYYPPDEIKAVESFLKASIHLDQYEKTKNVADYLAKSGKGWRAIRIYQDALRTLPKDRKELRASVYHNLGCTCARMFMFDSAADCFVEAFRLIGREEDMTSALAARRRRVVEWGAWNGKHPRRARFRPKSVSIAPCPSGRSSPPCSRTCRRRICRTWRCSTSECRTP